MDNYNTLMDYHKAAEQLKLIMMSKGRIFDHKPTACTEACKLAIDVLDNLKFTPPVPDACWIPFGNGYKCSSCGTLSRTMTNYCFYCGRSPKDTSLINPDNR